MWDGLFMLLGLSLVMGTASFLAGILPLSLSLSPRQLRLITALGTGVLVGTSLIVIIPEGVETLYAARANSHGHDEPARLSTRTNSWDPLRRAPSGVISSGQNVPVPKTVATVSIVDRNIFIRADSSTVDGDDNNHQSWDSQREEGVPQEPPSETPAHNHDFEPHAWIGVSVIFGFILMYLIDTLPQQVSGSSQPQSFPISLNQFSLTRTPSVGSTPPSQGQPSHSEGYSRPSSTTIGLVIHAAADGIALGASSTNSTQRLTFIIFIALMIHKAPAAFGLTSVLLKQGLSKRAARAHLIVFSLAAPVGALVTWFAAHLLGFSAANGSTNTEFMSGIVLLFSAGTFLYVAMHTMQENSSGGDGHNHGTEMNGQAYDGVPMQDMYDAPQAPVKLESRCLTETLVTVGGMLLPLLTQWGHAH
ncbi:Zinc transporter ZIP9 [Acrodontium crateriforme]|uniref:Zinc transporter ZIP9 n=1 Tax=Acrodontium crateriforme TaxID=150365 RepID=A0AAQ3M6L6_9PEZI|nr:Zinc transporter ZIP9 [Acrodontium crateriforme]